MRLHSCRVGRATPQRNASSSLAVFIVPGSAATSTLGTRHYAPETISTKAEALGWLSGVEVDIHRGGWVDEKAGR